MLGEPTWYELLRQRLREPEPNLAVRVGLSVVLALLVIVAALLVVWLWARWVFQQYVPDDWIALGLLGGGVIWTWLVFLVWRPMRHIGRLLFPVLFTLAAGLATGCAMFLIDAWFRSADEEMFMAVTFFGACAAVLLVWLVTFERLRTRRAVLAPDGVVQVNCPQCGYSLVSLRELRCPECGTAFTIDEVIRAQGYGGTEPAVRDSEGVGARRA